MCIIGGFALGAPGGRFIFFFSSFASGSARLPFPFRGPPSVASGCFFSCRQTPQTSGSTPARPLFPLPLFTLCRFWGNWPRLFFKTGPRGAFFPVKSCRPRGPRGFFPFPAMMAHSFLFRRRACDQRPAISCFLLFPWEQPGFFLGAVRFLRHDRPPPVPPTSFPKARAF